MPSGLRPPDSLWQTRTTNQRPNWTGVQASFPSAQTEKDPTGLSFSNFFQFILVQRRTHLRRAIRRFNCAQVLVAPNVSDQLIPRVVFIDSMGS
jgi:hypothetical protein